MKINLKYIALLTLVIGLLSSCSVSKIQRTARTASFIPTKVELQQTLNDYEYLGEVEIEVSYSRYLYVFSFMHTINGAPVSKEKNIVVLKGSQNLPIVSDWRLNRAMYKAFEKYPNADILMPTILTQEKVQLFLGSKIIKKAKIKAYKLRTK